MDNFKCLTTFSCDDLNEKDTYTYVNLSDAYETLCKELYKSMKIAKKFKEGLKLANLEKEQLIVRLDESNKKNEFLRNQFSSQLHVVYCVKVQLYILLKKIILNEKYDTLKNCISPCMMHLSKNCHMFGNFYKEL